MSQSVQPESPDTSQLTRPRVLLWSTRGSGTHYNGPGSFAYRLYSLSSRDEAAVSLVHGYPDQEQDSLFEQQHYLGCSPSGSVGLVTFLAKAKRWLRENAGNFDVMHALNGFHATAVPAGFAQQLGLPVVLFVTNHRNEFVDKPGIRGILRLPAKRRRIIRQLSAMIAMSTDIYSELREYDVQRRRIARIPMGVNTERFSPIDESRKRELRQELEIPDRPTIVFAGTVVRRKRPMLVAQAVEHAVRAGTDCQAYIVGPQTKEPEYAQQIKDYIVERKLDDRVKLVSFTPDIEKYHQAADLFVLPSEQEGMPAAMVEAMACGAPPLGTAISGVSDLIDDGEDGRIIEPTPESLADAFRYYFDDPTLIQLHSVRCREKVLERYSAQAVLAAYLKVFQIVRTGGDPCDASILPEME